MATPASVPFPPEECARPVPFQRANVNADEETDLADAIAGLFHLFVGGNLKLTCEKSIDSNDNGELDVTDIILVLSYLFIGGEVPLYPFTNCGFDPTPDELPCDSYERCPQQ